MNVNSYKQSLKTNLYALTFILTIILLCTSYANATPKTGVTLNLGMGFAQTTNENLPLEAGNSSFIPFSASLGYGFALNDNWALGLDLGVVYATSDPLEDISSTLILGPLTNLDDEKVDYYSNKTSYPLLLSLRYFVGDSGLNFYAKGGLSFNTLAVTKEYQNTKNSSLNYNKTTTYNNFSYVGGGGLNYQFNSGFNIGLDYTYIAMPNITINNTSNNVNTSNYMLTIGFIF